MIVLVRHGETDANRNGLLLGRADPPLNAAGHEQARALAASFAAPPPAAIVSSPLQRARATAAAISDASGVPIEVDDRLIEIDYGEWDEAPYRGLAPDVVIRWRADPSFAPPGGESLAALQARVEGCASELLERGGDDVIVAVSHVSPIKAAVAWALGAGPELSWRMRVDVASATRIAAGPYGPVLVGFNHVLSAR